MRTNQEKCAAVPGTSSRWGLNRSKNSNVFSNPSQSEATFGSIALSSGSTSTQITIGNFSMSGQGSAEITCLAIEKGSRRELAFCQIIYLLDGVREFI